MTVSLVFVIMFLLFLKHIIIDFPIYTYYVNRRYSTFYPVRMWLHTIAHGVATAAIIYFTVYYIPLWIPIVLGLFDSITHHTIDVTLMKMLAKSKCYENYRDWYYWIPQLDQVLHAVVYIIILGTLVILMM